MRDREVAFLLYTFVLASRGVRCRVLLTRAIRYLKSLRSESSTPLRA
jgi:hypothetical protein